MKIMKTTILLVALFLTGFDLEEKGVLKISLSNIKETGKIYAAVYSEGDNFPDPKFLVKKTMGEVLNGKCELHFEGLPFGTYAIAVYQDVNGNGKLDKGMFGIPEEPFAFSNNFRPRFGGPSFDKCAFDFKENNQTVNIEMINSLFGGD
jgi:uncharacterized protein (DUF2141 family)